MTLNEQRFSLTLSGELTGLRTAMVQHGNNPFWDQWYAGRLDGGKVFVLAIVEDATKARTVIEQALDAIGGNPRE